MYNVNEEQLRDMIGILEQIGWDTEGKVVHQSILGPSFTQHCRDLIKQMRNPPSNL